MVAFMNKVNGGTGPCRCLIEQEQLYNGLEA